MSCENLLRAELVTADGEMVVAGTGPGDDPDLLWGLRGGGGNFGVVIQSTYRLHPVGPEVYFALAFYEGERDGSETVLARLRAAVTESPDEVSALASCMVAPADGQPFPNAIRGRRYVAVAACSPAPSARASTRFGRCGGWAAWWPISAGRGRYVDVQRIWDVDYPEGERHYWTSLNLSRLDDEVIAQVARHARLQPSPLSTTDIWPLTGRQRGADPESSAFHRSGAAAMLSLEANWTDPAHDDVNIDWARGFLETMSPYSGGSRYLNFAGLQEDGPAMVRTSFGPSYARLGSIKRRLDPTNVFRLNQNVDPIG